MEFVKGLNIKRAQEVHYGLEMAYDAKEFSIVEGTLWSTNEKFAACTMFLTNHKDYVMCFENPVAKLTFGKYFRANGIEVVTLSEALKKSHRKYLFLVSESSIQKIKDRLGNTLSIVLY